MHSCMYKHILSEWLKHTIYPMHSTYSKCMIILYCDIIYIYMHTSIEREDRVLPCVLVYTHVVYACVLGYMHIHTQRQTCRPKGPTNKHSYQSWFKCRNPKIPLVTWWNLSTFEENPPPKKKNNWKIPIDPESTSHALGSPSSLAGKLLLSH